MDLAAAQYHFGSINCADDGCSVLNRCIWSNYGSGKAVAQINCCQLGVGCAGEVENYAGSRICVIIVDAIGKFKVVRTIAGKSYVDYHYVVGTGLHLFVSLRYQRIVGLFGILFAVLGDAAGDVVQKNLVAGCVEA